MSILTNFLKRYKLKEIMRLLLEQHLMFIFRSMPGYEGIVLRRLVYKLIFGKIGKDSLVYVNVHITHAYNMSIGHGLGINSGAHIDARGGVEIGDYVLIGPNVFIGSSNHVVSAEGGKPRAFFPHVLRSVKIGSNVWIGANSVICPGVRIGNNSVIGAGSVVTEDVDDSVLVGGNPVKVIKKIAL